MQNIFGIKKVTFDAYSADFEQDTMFIEIRECRPRIASNQGGRETAIVNGSIVVFSKDNALKFGFFNKGIEKADKKYVERLMFHNIDLDVATSPARLQNIHERRCDFTFLYDSQYDPNKGFIEDFQTQIQISGS